MTILGICTLSGLVSRYRTCNTLDVFRNSQLSSILLNINFLIHQKQINEEEFLNWIEMGIRTNEHCMCYFARDSIKAIVDQSDDPIAFLIKLENIFNKLDYVNGYTELADFYAHYTRNERSTLHSLHPFRPANRAIYCYEKVLQLIPNQPHLESSRSGYTSDIYERLAELYLEEGYPIDAFDRLAIAMKGTPDRHKSNRRLLLAKIYKNYGDFEAAEDQLNSLLNAQNNLTLEMKAAAYIELAEIAKICGRFQLAHTHLDSLEKETKEGNLWIFFESKVEKALKDLKFSEMLASS